MIIACLKRFGKMPFFRDKLTSFDNDEGCLYRSLAWMKRLIWGVLDLFNFINEK